MCTFSVLRRGAGFDSLDFCFCKFFVEYKTLKHVDVFPLERRYFCHGRFWKGEYFEGLLFLVEVIKILNKKQHVFFRRTGDSQSRAKHVTKINRKF